MLVRYFFSKSALITLLLIAALLSSCSRQNLLIDQSKIRLIERQDHQTCVERGVDIGDWDEMITELYWQCRYNFVMMRKMHNSTTAEAIKNNALIDKMAKDILQKINRAKYSVLAKIDDHIDLRDHEICIADVDLIGSQSNTKYYECRQNLVLKRTAPAPKITHIPETTIMDKKRATEYLAFAKSAKINTPLMTDAVNKYQDYPECSWLKNSKIDFDQCQIDVRNARDCLSGIEQRAALKNLENKFYCQDQSYAQFPDDYDLSKDKSKETIAKMKAQEFAKKQQREKEEKIKNLKWRYVAQQDNIEIDVTNTPNLDKETAKTASKKPKKTYSIIDIINLRENFIRKCTEIANETIPQFVAREREKCQKSLKKYRRD